MGALAQLVGYESCFPLSGRWLWDPRSDLRLPPMRPLLFWGTLGPDLMTHPRTGGTILAEKEGDLGPSSVSASVPSLPPPPKHLQVQLVRRGHPLARERVPGICQGVNPADCPLKLDAK